MALTSQMLKVCKLFRYRFILVVAQLSLNSIIYLTDSSGFYCFKEWDLVENLNGVLEFQTR